MKPSIAMMPGVSRLVWREDYFFVVLDEPYHFYAVMNNPDFVGKMNHGSEWYLSTIFDRETRNYYSVGATIYFIEGDGVFLIKQAHDSGDVEGSGFIHQHLANIIVGDNLETVVYP